MKDTAVFFDHEEKEILRQVEDFHKILTHLKYEGKARTGKNVRAASRAAAQLSENLKRHRLLQEKILFPFLKTHVPKYEAAICFLQTEHDDIRESKAKLKACLQRLSKDALNYAKQGPVYQTGIYLVSLLRHHISFENKTMQKSMRRELNAGERREIGKRMETWLKGNGNGKKKAGRE